MDAKEMEALLREGAYAVFMGECCAVLCCVYCVLCELCAVCCVQCDGGCVLCLCLCVCVCVCVCVLTPLALPLITNRQGRHQRCRVHGAGECRVLYCALLCLCVLGTECYELCVL